MQRPAATRQQRVDAQQRLREIYRLMDIVEPPPRYAHVTITIEAPTPDDTSETVSSVEPAHGWWARLIARLLFCRGRRAA